MITKPKGTYDVYGENGKKWKYVNEVINNFCEVYNYEYIKTPVFESSDLFHRTVGESSDIVTKETYDFKDRSDRSLTLRPEGTAGVVRSYIENKMYGDVNQPKKLYYNGTMYRYERPQSGRNREFTQFGIEILGTNDTMADAEIISFAYRLFEELGIEDLTVNINSLGDKESRENYKKALVEYLTPRIDGLCEDCQNRLKTNPLRILDCKFDKDNEILKNAPRILDYLNEESKERFNKVLEYLRLLDIDYEVNQNIVRGLDYYDHTVFEITTDIKELGNACVLGAGGRYNDLVKNLGGPETPCIGLACGVDRIITALDYLEVKPRNQKEVEAYVMYVNEEEKYKALELVQNLRLSGIITETDMLGKGLKAQFKAADRLNAKFLVILNSEDLAKGLINVKDNLTKEEIKVDENEIIDYFMSNI